MLYDNVHDSTSGWDWKGVSVKLRNWPGRPVLPEAPVELHPWYPEGCSN